tara:strand:- start:1654 stop:3642 length:1989 start_codon:yes stop_codon:yes gene_type:complete
MATHDYVIDNSTGANVRADINSVLQAILTNNSSSSSPSTTAAYMFWADTTSGTLKIRNSSDNAWVELLQLDGTLTLEDGSASTPALAFRDDLNTGIYSSAADTFNIATGGALRLTVDSSGNLLNRGEYHLSDSGTIRGKILLNPSDTDDIIINAVSLGANIDFKTVDTQRVRIDSSGRMLLGTTTEGHSTADDLTVATSGHTGITIRSGSSNNGNIYFSDGTTGNAELAGYIQYSHSSNYLLFGTNESNAMLIDSSGNVSIGIAGTTNRFHVEGTTTGSRFGVDVSTSGIPAIAATNESNADIELVIYDGRSSIGSSVNIPLAFHTNGKTNEKMRLQTSGALTIGSSNTGQVASGFAKLQIQSNDSTGRLSVIQHRNEVGAAPFITLGKSRASSVDNVTAVQDGDTLGTFAWVGGDGSTLNTSPIQLVGIVDGAVTTGEIAGTLVFKTMQTGSSSLAEKMRLTHNGYLGINNTSPAYKLDISTGGAVGARVRQTTNNQGEDHSCILLRHAAALSGQNGVGMLFQNSGGTTVGKIDFGASTTQYRTSSDYRLKENEVPISDGITRLKTLKPYRFNFIAEPDKTVDGFFAHEVTAVPEAISGTKDEVETTYYQSDDDIPEGKAVGDVKSTTSPVYQGIDHSKLVPLLVAAVQELITKVETLEAA